MRSNKNSKCEEINLNIAASNTSKIYAVPFNYQNCFTVKLIVLYSFKSGQASFTNENKISLSQ